MVCSWLSACPICNKCMAYDPGTHRCATCEFASSGLICKHKDNDRAMIIRRSNFKIKVGEDTKNWVRELGEKYG